MNKLIVLDANILIRAVLGERVPQLLQQYGKQTQFFTTATCYAEARRHLPTILEKRGLDPVPFLAALVTLEAVVIPLTVEIYLRQ